MYPCTHSRVASENGLVCTTPISFLDMGVIIEAELDETPGIVVGNIYQTVTICTSVTLASSKCICRGSFVKVYIGLAGEPKHIL